MQICVVLNDFPYHQRSHQPPSQAGFVHHPAPCPHEISSNQLNELLNKIANQFTQEECHMTLLSSRPLKSYLKKQLSSFPSSSSSKVLIHTEILHYEGPRVSSVPPAVHSYHVMEWLLKNRSKFNVVLFPLTGGVGYYSILAKHQGWAFQQTLFCLDCASATLWHKHIHNQWMDHLDDLSVNFLEKESIRLADAAIIKNGDLLRWMKKNNWLIPECSLVDKEDEKRKEGDADEYYRNFFKSLKVKKHPQENTQELFFSNFSPFSSSSYFFSSSSSSSSQLNDDSHPVVSVCLTHFNRSHYLAQALESIKAQTQDHASFEVILVDDASTQPEAIAYLESLREEFQNRGWTIIRNEKNLFPGAARNRAARIACGALLEVVKARCYKGN